MTNEEYGRYVDALAPRSKTGKNLLNAKTGAAARG